jgi:hypothetical protein
MLKTIVTLSLFGFCSAVHAGWFWGQYRTPIKVVADGDKFYVQFQEGPINPQNCAMPVVGAVIRRAVVGDDQYKSLYALFMAALVAQMKVELNVTDDCNYGPNVVTASIGL